MVLVCVIVLFCVIVLVCVMVSACVRVIVLASAIGSIRVSAHVLVLDGELKKVQKAKN